MKIFFAFILLLAIACSSIFGLMDNENEQFIQGSWQVAGEHISDKGVGETWFLEWEFENGRFTQNGNSHGDIPILQGGNYKIIENRDNIIKLKLYRQNGTFGEKDSELIIVIDRENKKLEIDGKSRFTKISI